ncbi:MAG: 3-mercaptopyruvate sulfurtransferase [Azospirillaceae bacterium]|nr:3-mercaptopyruvate sulfurtransferase [Azospirillaceae bacterium]
MSNPPHNSHTDALVSTAWLAEHLKSPDIRVVDASWYMPGTAADARAEYRARHIPGAVYFDIDAIADTANHLPHMLPSPEIFAAEVGRLGLGAGIRIVVYAGQSLMSAARVWWMFRVFGHEDVGVLDGGLTRWLAEGRPVDDEPPAPRSRAFSPRFNGLRVRDAAQILANIATDREQIVDVRARPRFEGTVAEPWPGRRMGHIPGAFNLPYADLVDASGTALRTPDQIAPLVAATGLRPVRPVVASCGSGVTACVAALALHVLGWNDVAVYDGSWAEWGLRDDLPIEQGPSRRVKE